MADGLPHQALARAVAATFGPDVRITATERLCGDASNRIYARLHLGPHQPPTVVAMLLGEGPYTGGSDEIGGGHETELPFVNVGRYLAHLGLPVPRIFHDAARSDGLLLSEDIGDRNLWSVVSDAPGEVATRFAAAVDLLVRLQVLGTRSPDPA